MSVTKIGEQKISQIDPQQAVRAISTAKAKGTTPSDVAGAPTSVIGASSLLPSPHLTETELQQALDKLQAKSPDVQKALSEAMAAFAVNPQLAAAFNAQTYGKLLNDVVSAAKNNLGAPFDKLFATLDASLATARGAAGSDANILAICDTAAKIVDLLRNPQDTQAYANELAGLLTLLTGQTAALSAEANKVVNQAQAEVNEAKRNQQNNPSGENQAKLDAAEKKLAKAREKAAKLNEAAGLGAMLDKTLRTASDATKLGRDLTILLNRLQDIEIQQRQPDALAFSGRVTAAALAGLMLLLASQVQDEVAKRIEQADKETKMLEEMQEKGKDFKKFLRDMARAANETRENTLTSGSSLVAMMAQSTDDGWRLVNEMLARRGAGSLAEHPA